MQTLAGPYVIDALDACPLCRATLEPSAAPERCPSCAADLSLYTVLRSRAQELLSMAAEALARGDLTLAREVSDSLEMLVPPGGSGLALLRARLALARSDWDGALAQLPLLDNGGRRSIEAQLGLAQRLALEARELYNSALVACREGEFTSALRLLGRACGLDAANPAVWTLRAKAALKAGDWAAARESLAALSRLGSRPADLPREIDSLVPGI
jgi:uncharacterized protein HemY